MPTDAGSAVGAVIAAPNALLATDTCDGSTPVTLAVTYPDTTTGTTWPAGGRFPIGTTTLVWTSVDTAGNQATETRTIEVLNHQLLDLTLSLSGVVSGNSTRTMRVSVGGNARIENVPMTGANGALPGLQVPVAASYACFGVKDTAHSLTTRVVPSISNAKWVGVATLLQGDTNDDDRVDILDFGTFVASRGTVVATNHPSNFNGDTLVNNVDLTFISFSFFRVGDTCTGYTGEQPLARVSIPALRRMGMGHLAVADVNGDGWLDDGDVAYYMQHGAPIPAAPWMPVSSEN
jgi:hypothetical protein